jgi:hypothetical protein
VSLSCRGKILWSLLKSGQDCLNAGLELQSLWIDTHAVFSADEVGGPEHVSIQLSLSLQDKLIKIDD